MQEALPENGLNVLTGQTAQRIERVHKISSSQQRELGLAIAASTRQHTCARSAVVARVARDAQAACDAGRACGGRDAVGWAPAAGSSAGITVGVDGAR